MHFSSYRRAPSVDVGVALSSLFCRLGISCIALGPALPSAWLMFRSFTWWHSPCWWHEDTPLGCWLSPLLCSLLRQWCLSRIQALLMQSPRIAKIWLSFSCVVTVQECTHMPTYVPHWKMLKHFIYVQYGCGKQFAVVYSLNHNIMVSFPTQNCQNLTQLWQCNGVHHKPQNGLH